MFKRHLGDTWFSQDSGEYAYYNTYVITVTGCLNQL